jgi:hypothetical protein
VKTSTEYAEPEVVGHEGDGGPGDAPTAPAGPPVHPLSAVVLIAVDNLWNFADWAVVSWAITVPLSFLTVAMPTFVIQRKIKKDSIGKSLRMAALLGGLAAVPTSLFGTPVGLAFLAWSGINKLLGGQPPVGR